MPFEAGMDKFLQSFAPVHLNRRLKLKPPPIDFRKTLKAVADWYTVAAALEETKPMHKYVPMSTADKVHMLRRYAHGSYYTGEWINGKRHGEGEYLLESKGALYRGEWRNGTLHGQGAMFNRKPDKTWFLTYIGNYKNGLRDGWGTYRWDEEEFYEGSWVKGKREGWGRQFVPDGTIYEGHWQDDKKHGYGATREGYGNHHSGQYYMDTKNGPGKYCYINTGKCFRGTWKRDIPVCGDIIQLKRYRPSFPHQYSMPELGLADPQLVLDRCSEKDCSAAVPKTSEAQLTVQPEPCLASSGLSESVVETKNEVTADNYLLDFDMRRELVEVEPDIVQINEPFLAVETANFLLSNEYLWRSTADRFQIRPKRVRKLLAINSQEFAAVMET